MTSLLKINESGGYRFLPGIAPYSSGVVAMPGFEIVLWNGIFVPTGTPKDVVQKLSNAVQSVLQDPGVLAKLAEQGSTPIKSNPDDFKKVIDAEIVKWGDLIKMAGARVD